MELPGSLWGSHKVTEDGETRTELARGSTALTGTRIPLPCLVFHMGFPSQKFWINDLRWKSLRTTGEDMLSLCWLVCHSDGIIQVPCSRDDEVWRKVPQVIKLILFKQHWILKDPHKRLRTSVPFEAEHIIYNMNTQMSVLQQMKIIPVNHKSLLLTSWFIIMFQLVKVIWSSWTISFRAEIAPNI